MCVGQVGTVGTRARHIVCAESGSDRACERGRDARWWEGGGGWISAWRGESGAVDCGGAGACEREGRSHVRDVQWGLVVEGVCVELGGV